MAKENRFEGLMGVVGKNKDAQTSKHSDVKKPGSRKKTASKSNVQTSTSKVDNSKSNASTSKHSNVQTSKKAKSVNPDYTRTTVYLPKKMHKKLKAIALEQETEMSSIVEELIEGWLNTQS